MEPTQVFPIVSLLSLAGVEYGGWALLSFLTVREGLSDFQKQFFRAGHAHAGVLLVLSLVYFVYLDRTEFTEATQWIAGAVLLTGILAQSGGFFLHMAAGEAGQASVGTRVTRAGGLTIGVALVILAIGIAQT
ncbi:MAG: hypothetical protein ACRDY4_01360 [Acidimicrobiia bacterium]